MVRGGREIQGKLRDQMSLKCIRQSAEVFQGDGMNICLTHDGLSLPGGQHIHEEYEFLMPLSESIVSKVDSKYFIIRKNRFFPVNSGQAHGPENNLENFRFLCVEVNRSYLDELTFVIYGEKNIKFTNNNFHLCNEDMFPIWSILKEYRNRQTGYERIVHGLQLHIALNFLRNARHNLDIESNSRNYPYKQVIDRALENMNANLESRFSLEDLAAAANLSTYHFIRVFKNQTGKTPYECFMDLKIERAKDLLGRNSGSVTDVCMSCGFNSISHFTETFKKKVGVSPSQYRIMLNS